MTAVDRGPQESGANAVGRRRFLGYVLAAPTLVAAAELGLAQRAEAVVPSPGVAELLDLNDLLTEAARPTANLIAIEVNKDGTVSFALPRTEVGQGITTSTAMLIAEEMDVPLADVRVTLADARPELLFTSSPAGRTRPSPPTPRSASPPPSPGAGCCGPPPSNSTPPSPT